MNLNTTPVRILLAGPNSFRWRSYQKFLDTDRASARLSISGLDCVAELRAFRPNVLVLDPNVPWGGGDGILAVRDEEPELKNNLVMILTVGCDHGLLYRISDYAIDDFVGQPISAASLQRRLERLLEFQRDTVSTPG